MNFNLRLWFCHSTKCYAFDIKGKKILGFLIYRRAQRRCCWWRRQRRRRWRARMTVVTWHLSHGGDVEGVWVCYNTWCILLHFWAFQPFLSLFLHIISLWTLQESLDLLGCWRVGAPRHHKQVPIFCKAEKKVRFWTLWDKLVFNLMLQLDIMNNSVSNLINWQSEIREIKDKTTAGSLRRPVLMLTSVHVLNGCCHKVLLLLRLQS